MIVFYSFRWYSIVAGETWVAVAEYVCTYVCMYVCMYVCTSNVNSIKLTNSLTREVSFVSNKLNYSRLCDNAVVLCLRVLGLFSGIIVILNRTRYCLCCVVLCCV